MRRTGIPDGYRRCATVPTMFATTIRNWWWTAHPAAH
ncbi:MULTISPECIES: trp operon leader peptide [unclassified Streptomyces]